MKAALPFLLAFALPVAVRADAQAPAALQPFEAAYEAYNAGKPAGNATMRVVRRDGAQWRVDLGIHANRGVASLLGLDIEQSTVFDAVDERYRPLSQSTVRKGAFLGSKQVGTYDWSARNARWQGDVKEKHRRPIELREGDMSGLLINLAIVRDAQPGRQLHYRFVDGGRVREHLYQVAQDPEVVAVGELSYQTMRVARTNGGNDETVFWVADGVPTPVRILQRENGQDGIDLRLTGYQGTP